MTGWCADAAAGPSPNCDQKLPPVKPCTSDPGIPIGHAAIGSAGISRPSVGPSCPCIGLDVLFDWTSCSKRDVRVWISFNSIRYLRKKSAHRNSVAGRGFSEPGRPPRAVPFEQTTLRGFVSAKPACICWLAAPLAGLVRPSSRVAVADIRKASNGTDCRWGQECILSV
jgi:hypothetical protein